MELAKALGITVVAEGVETEAQASFLSGMQCGELQGFLFCRPLPVDQLQRFLATEAAAVPAPAGLPDKAMVLSSVSNAI